jgi:glycosyltransferase 2 family protein
VLALRPCGVFRLEEADLPEQRSRDRKLDRDHGLEVLNGHVQARSVWSSWAQALLDAELGSGGGSCGWPVTHASPDGSGQDDAADRSWGVALLTDSEPGRRNRRTLDSILLILAATIIGLSAAIAASAERQDRDIARALATVLGWAGPIWRAAFFGLLGLAIVVVVDVLFRRRWDLARDLLGAALGLVGAMLALGRAVESDWLPIKAHVLSRWGYPEIRVAAAVAALVVVGPELVRSVRLLAIWLVPLAALGAVVLGAALPSGALGALALGLGVGALVRLAFGTAAGVPPTAEVRRALTALGVEVDDLRPSLQQRIGAAEYVGHDEHGRPLKVRVLARDAQDTQRLARRWRALAYRDPPRTVADGRLEQVEHEALATLMAARAGVRVPDVVIAALGPNGDAVIATVQPDIEPLERSSADEVSDETLQALCTQAARLHAAGISHGRLNTGNVLVLDEGPMLIDLSAATLGAPQSALDIDVAELLVSCTVLVGPERALRKAMDARWGDVIARVLPYLQRAALTPHLRDLARSHEVGLKALRTAAAAAAGTELPDMAPLRRVRPRDLLLTAALVFAAYLLISKLAQIGFGTIAHELGRANPAWLVVALFLAQSTFVPSGISVRGAVAAPLPLLPCVVLQSAMKFINLTVPSTAGRIGMNLRFLDRMGVPRPQAVVAGAVDDTSNTIVQAALLLLSLALVKDNLDTSEFHETAPDSRLVLAIVVAVVVSVAVILVVPKLRAKVVPGVRSGLSGLWSVARLRRKRLELFGGTLASELLYALSLGATCLAYGVDLDFAQLVFVNTGASVLSSVIPTPGGIGAAEASLSAGLIAMGVDEPTAFAIAVTQRLWTFYLPPIWGFVSLKWLSRRGYV